MTEDNTFASAQGVSRRTLVKGAAWSLPVIAVAAATPLASASTVTWNGAVAGVCSNDYDLSALQNLLDNIGLGGLVGVVQTALKTLLDLDPGATRGFNITATAGEIPAGTQYVLTDPNALLTLSGLEAVIAANVAGIASTSDGYVLTLTNPIPEGSTVFVNVYDAIVNVGALSSFTLTQTTADANAGDNAGSTASLAAVAVNLDSLGIPLLSGSLAVQTCDL
ncbi:MAG: hypothetical protein WAK00_03975 [Microbacterium sp.]|uniref:hypothetical protein n=1 Tax=Microbacterium sp. TaxID=51671 RepID=UPI003BB162C9